MRDFQRQRVYNAEDILVDHETGKPEPHLDSVQAIEWWLDNKVVNRAWFKRNFWLKDVFVRPGRGAKRAFASRLGPYGQLTLPRWARQEQVVLHELAHCIGPTDCAAHGPEFVGSYLYLTEKVRGKEVAQQLMESFRNHGVLWSFKHIEKW